jgi:hypothetical protein
MSWDDPRDDMPEEPLPLEDVFANAPNSRHPFFVVPSQLPLDGKLIVGAPEVAVLLHELADEPMKDRIFTMAGLPPDQALVIDMDEMTRLLQLPPRMRGD